MRGRAKGFTLVEILIVVGVVAIGLLGTMSVFFWGIRAGEEGARMSQAINYSREMLEAIRVRNLAFAGTNTITSDANLLGVHDLDHMPLDTLGLPTNSIFKREITITRLGTSGYQARIAVINVKTTWTTKSGREKSAEIEGYASVQ